MTSGDESREQGVEFGPLAEDLEQEEYPMGKLALLERYGDREIVLEDDTEPLESVLGPLGEREFESARDVKQAVIGMVSDEAIGRKDYTDRGGETDTGEDDESL